MSQIVKMYLGLFFILLEALVGMGVVTAAMQSAAARDYHADVIREVECSNFSPGVIQACRAQAEEAGYQVEIEPVSYDEERNLRLASVTLKYEYAIKVLNLVTQHEIRGMAG